MAANKNYPAIRFVLRYGNTLATAVGAAIVVPGLWMGLRGAWIAGIAVVLGGLLGYLLLRTFAELVDVVADTLLPPE